jgi:glycerate-2-kinase
VVKDRVGEFLTINTYDHKEKINLKEFKRIFIVGIGKGSALASVALAKILGKKLTSGIALDVQKPKLKIKNLKLEILIGTHPLPSEKNIKATSKIIKLAKNLKKDDLLITFICGGGSALACANKKELKGEILATKELTKAGTNIIELNTVRKHLPGIKGGDLAKLAYPATVFSLIVSDVLGNNLSMVASGPTVFDKTTKKDAEKILKKYLRKSVFKSALSRILTETPKDKKFFEKVNNILFVRNKDAVMAMAEKAKKLGFSVKIYSLALQGEAKDALLSMIAAMRKMRMRTNAANNNGGKAILAGGETTVTLEGRPKGKGGRNMEAVLGAIAQTRNSKSEIRNLVILSFASDGRDNTEAAGAMGDSLTLQTAEKLGINPRDFLEKNKSFDFFDRTGDLIYAKQSCFNVADLMIVLKLSN